VNVHTRGGSRPARTGSAVKTKVQECNPIISAQTIPDDAKTGLRIPVMGRVITGEGDHSSGAEIDESNEESKVDRRGDFFVRRDDLPRSDISC
jgi:hypothetical protein